MNIQEAIEYSKNGALLPICEYFYSLQGEGYHFGRAVLFLRLSGCDVGCKWCDTKHSWGVNEKDFLKIEEVLDIINKSGADCVVITGGEPTIYNLDGLIDEIHKLKIEVNMETSGTREVSSKVDWVTLSPKRCKQPLPQSFMCASELKVVISCESDFEFAEDYREMVSENCKLYLQPEWGSKDSLNMIIEYIKLNTKWRLSLQTHKYINIE